MRKFVGRGDSCWFDFGPVVVLLWVEAWWGKGGTRGKGHAEEPELHVRGYGLMECSRR